MLSARLRFPSRGSMAVATHAGGRAEGPMLTPAPPEAPIGQFKGNGPPLQNLVATGVRELFISMYDAATAIRLGGTSALPRYFGTVLPQPQVWRSPAETNSEDNVRAAVINAGNAPQMENKTAVAGQPPRIASSLPQRNR